MRLEIAKYKKNAMLRQQEENPQDVVVSSLLPESKSGSKVDGIKADSKMRKAIHRESEERDWGGILHTLTKCWVVYFREKSKKTGDALRIP